jgi:hypothetical protein
MIEEEKKEEEEVVDETIIEYTTRESYISSAYFAISSVEAIDTELMSKEDSRRIKRIIKKSIKIIDDCISEMYGELFDDDVED